MGACQVITLLNGELHCVGEREREMGREGSGPKSNKRLGFDLKWAKKENSAEIAVNAISSIMSLWYEEKTCKNYAE